MILTRSIHSPSSLPNLHKCQSCDNLISNVSQRGMARKFCDECLKNKTKRALRFANSIYNKWDKTTPIYKYDVLHQTALKFAILNNKTDLTDLDRKMHNTIFHRNYVNKHNKKISNYQRTYKKLIIQLRFAKFWDGLE